MSRDLASMPASSPEVELLLSCARTDRSPEVAAKIEALLQEDLDWEYLLRTARRHGVAPLVYRQLEATCPEAVAEDALGNLRAHFLANNMRNLFLTGELLRLLNLFKAHGISAVAYKGPALAASVYGNLALREFHDLDILVNRRDVPKSKEVLASAGYQARYRLTREQEEVFLRVQCEHPFTREDGKSVVELHWGVVEKHFLPFDTEHLWKRLDHVLLGGDLIPILSPEDTLLILCVHGSKHAWERLGWVCDIAELIRAHQGIDWERVAARAVALGGERMLLLGLRLASDLLGTTLPDKVSRRVWTDPTVGAQAERIREQLFRETGGSEGFLEGYEGVPPFRALGYEGVPPFHALHLGTRERLRDKVRYCVRKATALSGEDWELLPLPKFLFPVYYILRPIRLVIKRGSKALKRL